MVPFDPSAVRLMDVQFNQPGAWVTSVTPNGFEANLGDTGSDGQDVQMTASFTQLRGYTRANPLPTSIAYSYRDDENATTSNGTINTQLRALQQTGAAQTAPASMIASAGGTLPINSTIFAPGESVAFWYNAPNGQVLPLYIHDWQITTTPQHQEEEVDGTTHYMNNGAYLGADPQGAIGATLWTDGLAQARTRWLRTA
jgi:hypothetical protein